MLISVRSRLRRRRRPVLAALAALTLALVALTAHAAAMDGAMGHHGMSDTASLCLTVGGALAVIGLAAVGARNATLRLRWAVPAPAMPVPTWLPAAAGVLVRAGPPPPSSLQVFRL